MLVLAGDVAIDDAVALAARHLGAWQAPNAPASTPADARAADTVRAPRVDASTVAIDQPGSGQAAIVMAAPLPPRVPEGDRDAATAAVLNAVLGGGYSSRLNQEIRIRSGLSYGAGSSIELRPRGGVLVAAAQARNENAAAVVAAMQRQVEQLIDTAVPEDELAARKAALVGHHARSLETTDGLAAQLVARVVAGLPVEGVATRAALLSAVEPGDVQRYARTHLSAARRRVAVVGDAARFTAPLLAAEPRAARLRLKDLGLD